MKNEAKIIGTILGIVLFIVLVAGATYAYLLLKSETDLTTGTGKFSIDYKINRFKHNLQYGPQTGEYRNVIAPLYGDDGIVYYSSILGDIPAPVIGNNAYRLQWAYLHYGDTYVNINGQFYQGYTGSYGT